ncbi:MAG: hypothetical protein JO288_07130, partial [Hyphomicrobiales bacterium]|nr:hypothetical protein [Hyphomicrobiales bacterium]
MTVPTRPNGRGPAEPAAERAARQAAPSPTELALMELERFLASLEAPAQTRSRAPGESNPPPPPPIAAPPVDTRGESAVNAAAGAVPATGRRSRRLPGKAVALALAAGAATLGAVFALERQAPGLSEALRLVGAPGDRERTLSPPDGAAKQSEAKASASDKAEAAPPAVVSTPKPVEAPPPAGSGAVEPPAEAAKEPPFAASAGVPAAAPPAVASTPKPIDAAAPDGGAVEPSAEAAGGAAPAMTVGVPVAPPP